jgi:diphthine-ammonia ligase
MQQFYLSFSSGKDCILALDTFIKQGYQPAGLITNMDEEINRSWFHGVPVGVLENIATALNLPLVIVKSNSRNYEEHMIAALTDIKEQGVANICFGDIDIEENGAWDKKIATQAGLIPHLPLWQKNREELVHQFLSRGYTAIIKTVSKESGIPTDFLGQPLNQTFINYLLQHNLDVCGENGEYHTLVIDGPLFAQPVNFRTNGIYESPYAYSLIIESL